MSNPPYVFLNDEIVPWDEAKVHVASVGFKFGTAVFEGLRGYWNAQQEQLYVFQLDAHMERLTYSQRFMRFENIIDGEYVAQKTIELLRVNGFRENVHIMATVFVNGFGGPTLCGPLSLAITAAPRVDNLWVQNGCSAQVSAWQRVADNAMPMRVKCNANYQNGRLAWVQAKADDYDTAILLNSRGKISEGPSMCLFMIRDGKAVTSTITSDILESITRATALELLRDECGIETVERDMDRSELVAAVEAFYCGTAWEVTPITSIDRMPVGNGEVGPIVRKLQDAYFSAARGETKKYAEWRTSV